MSRWLCWACCLLCSWPGISAAEDYQFPFEDPFESTVFGTPADFKADLPPLKDLDRTEYAIDIFPGQEVPEVLWYNEHYRFTAVIQDKPAPLVFSIAGTGGSHNGGKMIALERAFHKAGYHVISLSSPTHPNFVVAASEEKMPGALRLDALELYNVMQKALAHVQEEEGDDFQVTDYYLTGYSLGAAHSAFISHIDEEKKKFNFSKVYMVNPPVSLYNSVIKLDGYVESFGGVKSVPEFINGIFERMGEQIAHESKFELTPEFIYSLYKHGGGTDVELARLIGVAFRISSIDMIFAIDVMNNNGWITYKNHTIDKFENVGHSFNRGADVGFLSYFEGAMLPHFQERYPHVTRTDAIRAMSLHRLEDYLKHAEKISVVTNRDDVILAAGDIEFLQKTFGDRAKIYPYGGHCGNMDEKVWVDDMLRFFANGQG